REGGGYTDSITVHNLRTQKPAERFVISFNSHHEPNANAADDEVTSVVRSSVSDPAILTTTVATKVVADTFAPVPKAGYGSGAGQAWPSIFRDFVSPIIAEADVAGPSHPVGIELSEGSFYVSQDMDPEDLRRVYIPKWNVTNDSALDDPEICQGMTDHLAPPGLKERDVEIASLKAQLFLKEVEAAEAIRLCDQIENVEAAEAAIVNELNDVKARNVALEGQVADLEFAAASKDAELASSNSQASLLEFEKDKLIDQIEAAQDVQVKVLSDRVAELDVELMRIALHLDEEFYTRYLTTIAGRRWILSRGLRLVVTKCLQSPEYLAALGGVIGHAIDKGIQDGLVAGIDHDSSMYDLMDLLRLEGPVAKTSEAEQLQPSPVQLMLLIHRLEDQVIIGETSLSFSLVLAYARVRKLKEGATSRRLSISDTLFPIVEPLSAENLVGEASTSGVPTVAATTNLSTTFIEAASVPPIPHAEAPLSSIVFEKEELDTTPEH
ncbi:hypothetical protein Tco_0735296, partial [Tanacetum coccineum]